MEVDCSGGRIYVECPSLKAGKSVSGVSIEFTLLCRLAFVKSAAREFETASVIVLTTAAVLPSSVFIISMPFLLLSCSPPPALALRHLYYRGGCLPVPCPMLCPTVLLRLLQKWCRWRRFSFNVAR